MTSPAVTYALWPATPGLEGVLEAQLRAAGLRPGMVACWCDVATAIAVVKGLAGTFQAGGMSYESVLGYAINWLDGVEE